MEASTTINKMLAGNRIYVPDYQRAYSWETEFKKNNAPKHVNVFLSDLESYNESSATVSYYFGHFLFEENQENNFGLIDGQQRLTTIIIFLSALFSKLKKIRSLTENEEVLFENIIKRKSNYIFSTVKYDDQLFKDYVINQNKKNINGLETASAKRIVAAFQYFADVFEEKGEQYLSKMLETVTDAFCSTHIVKNGAEAIQMFIFQNNRGKKPSSLEIIKAQFMFNVHLFGSQEKDSLLEEIKNRFEKIYKSISLIEHQIDEDDILLYTIKVYFNSLWESNPIEKISKELSENNSIVFIKEFTDSLEKSFDVLKRFFCEDERENNEIHSLITLGGLTLAIPFIIKAYIFAIPMNEINILCNTLESLVLRHRLIGTRAEMISRLNDVYKNFTSDQPKIDEIIARITWMKTENSPWWSYWNNSELKKSIQGNIDHKIAKFILWKYENYLEGTGKAGYVLTRFDKIENPELEHIAPRTPTNNEPIAAGYCKYDEEFENEYVDCLGNYLLLSKSHNCSVGNEPFIEKRKTYNYLAQQREIQEMTRENPIWNKNQIRQRKNKIIRFILDTF